MLHISFLVADMNPTLISLLDVLGQKRRVENFLVEEQPYSLCRAPVGHSLAKENEQFVDEAFSIIVHKIVQKWMRQEGRFGPIRTDWEMLCYCLLSSATLGEALKRAEKFHQITEGRSGLFACHMFGSNAEVRIESCSKIRNRLSLSVEMIGLHNLHALFGWLIKQTVPVTNLTFKYPEKFVDYEIPGLFPLFAKFGESKTAFQFPVRFLDLPIVRNASEVHEILDRRFLINSDTDRKNIDLPAQVYQIIANSIIRESNVPSLEVVAERLCYSSATLRRRLSMHKTCYRDIKEACRQKNAKQLLTSTNLSIEEISAKLAYCNADAFSAAFKSWMGLSPKEFRRRQKGFSNG